MPTDLPDNVFRANVGAIIINKEGLVLAFERKDIKGAWQLPQGGLKIGEEPVDAVFREIEEETSIHRSMIELVSEYPEWLTYELDKSMRTKKHGRGQAQKWFLFLYKGSNADIDVSNAKEREFSDWKWMKMDDLIESAPKFRKNIYMKLRREFSDMIK